MLADNLSANPLVHTLPNPTEWANNTRASIAVTLLSAILLGVLFLRPGSDENVYDVGGIPILATWTFFTKRYAFIRSNFKKSGGKMFRFRVLQHRVVSLTGGESRKLFFTDPSFDLVQGQHLLVGGIPRLEDADIRPTAEGETEDVQSEVDGGSSFPKRIAFINKRERLDEVLPMLFDDLNRRMKDWGNAGKLNPFKEVPDLVFQLTIRMSTCKEFSEDRKALEDLAQVYWTFEKSATPVAVLLPWFPGPAKRAKKQSATAMYTSILHFVEIRRNAAVPSNDPIDFWIAEGHSNETIVGTIMVFIFATIVNTGVNSSWALLYLGSKPEWKRRVIDELKALVVNHTNTLSSDPLYKRLATIPSNAWEDELPALDLVIRETLRMTLGGSALRRNVDKDITVDGLVIKRGDFMTYQVGEAHLDPQIYTNPEDFDPSRYLEGREEDRKQTFAFLGWGAGRHPCIGMKIAKLQIKLIVAMILLGFEYDVVDDKGKYPNALPKPDRNDIQQIRPLGDPCYLRFTRVAR